MGSSRADRKEARSSNAGIRSHGVGHKFAYDIVLRTAEGMSLRQEHDALVRG